LATWLDAHVLEDRRNPSFVASDRVEGTPIYGADGKPIGRIEQLIIDKVTGRVAYAVLSFGGFLGIGSHHYPIPWSLLTFNEKLGGYQVSITEEQLKDAPKFGLSENQKLHDYWNVTYPWPPDD
jgi:hypothetical protein